MTSWARWLPAAAVASGIFWFSHQSGSGLPDTGVDKIQHALAYGVLALALWHGLGNRFRVPRVAARRGMIAATIAALYGWSDEFHQSFIPGRDASLYDWIADVFGAVVVVTMLAWASFAGLRGVWDNWTR